MSKDELRKYIPDSPKEISFIGSSIVRLSSAISGGLVLTGHPLWSLLTILLTWFGHEMEQYFKIHEEVRQSESSGSKGLLVLLILMIAGFGALAQAKPVPANAVKYIPGNTDWSSFGNGTMSYRLSLHKQQVMINGVTENVATESYVNSAVSSSGSTVTCLYVSEATTSFSNTVTETTIIPSGTGSLTLPANTFEDGSILRITGRGAMSCGAGTLTIIVKLGGSSLASVTIAPPADGASRAFDFEMLLNCNATGVSGSVLSEGEVSHNTSTTAKSFVNWTGSSTVNTTTSQVLDVTATFSSANALSQVVIRSFAVEFLNP
jgi:hypothetical protein